MVGGFLIFQKIFYYDLFTLSMVSVSSDLLGSGKRGIRKMSFLFLFLSLLFFFLYTVICTSWELVDFHNLDTWRISLVNCLALSHF